MFAETAWGVTRRDGLSGIWWGIGRLTERQGGNPLLGVLVGGGNDYTDWVRRYDTLTESDRAAMVTEIAAFASRPLLSVVLPTYNTPVLWLNEAVQSVRRQVYPNWELCISDDASTSPAVRPVLDRLAALDPRISVVYRQTNGHICASTNSALELVRGEWVVLLDHDDVLPEHALFWVAKAANAHPNAQMIYSDEEKISAKGVRRHPYFKPDWNRDLFLSQNMFSHLGAFRAKLIRQVGGFRLGYEGAQDYDLALRCTEQVQSDQIVHIPKILYSWRMHEASTASTNAAKPYAAVAAERAINDHLARVGVSGKAEFTGHGYRVRYASAPSNATVGVVIVGGQFRDWRRCIESLYRQDASNPLDVVIVHAAEKVHSGQQEWAAQENVRLLAVAGAFHWATWCALGVSAVRGDFLLFLDAGIDSANCHDWLREMLSQAVRPDIGAVGAKLWGPDGRLVHAGVVFGLRGVAGFSHLGMQRGKVGYFGRANLVQNYSAVSGACMAIRRKIFDAVGGFAAGPGGAAFADLDLCLRLGAKGLRTLWTPYAELVLHSPPLALGHQSSPADLEEAASYMHRKWAKVLTNDPAYNPNLTLERTDFSYAWPPR